MNKQIANQVLSAMTVPNKRRTYVVGCFENRITIYSQQLRALNLTGSLLTCKKITKDSSIGIIGGGITGIMCAAALVNSGCEVEIYEAAEDIFHIQAGNKNRFLHPNIYDWPWTKAGEEITRTSLPFFNWSPGRTDQVINSFLLEYKLLKEYKNFKAHTSTRICSLTEKLESVELKSSSNKIREHDYVIYAGGFGVELSINKKNQTSYWFNDVYDQVLRDTANSKKLKYAIIGTGDGGLTDCIRIAIRNFDHVNFFKKIINNKQFKLLATKMRMIEQQISSKKLDENRISIKLAENYKNLPIPNTWRDLLDHRQRSDINKILLIGKNYSPFSTNTSIINRMLIYILLQSGHIEYQSAIVDEQMVAELEEKDDFKIVERIGPQNEFFDFFGLKSKKSFFKEQKSKQLESLNVGTVKIFDNSLFGNLKLKQVLKKILVVLNNKDENVRKRFAHFEVALETSFFNDFILPRAKAIPLNPTKHEEKINKSILKDVITKWNPEIIIFMSSDLFYLRTCVSPHKISNIIYFGEDKLVQEACFKSRHKIVLGLAQKVVWRDICNLFLLVPAKRIGYILNDDYPGDRYFYDSLQTFIKGENGLSSKLTVAVIRVEEVETRKNNFDLFIGRYFGHVFIDSFAHKIPYASPYKEDLYNGAILTYDLLDVEIANILAENLVKRILVDDDIQSCIVTAPGTKISLELKNASKFKIQFSKKLLEVSRHYSC